MLVLIKGAGDIASGIALRLFRSGFSVVMTDLARPTAVRRTVCFCEAIRHGRITVEDAEGVYIPWRGSDEAMRGAVTGCIDSGKIPVLADPEAHCLSWLKPDVLVDAILAKKNLGTAITDAPVVIGVGPGFCAGEDCHRVIETNRGHYLGRVITKGSAAPNTGIPGNIGGYTLERVLRAPAEGIFRPEKAITDQVKAGETAARVNDKPVICPIDGVLRGLLADGTPVTAGMKCGDIDPRCERDHCFCASDKALSIGGGVLEAILSLTGKPKDEGALEGGRLLERLRSLHEQSGGGILCRIIASEGSVPREEGAMMAVMKSGECLGTIGGGAVERLAQRRAGQLLDKGAPLPDETEYGLDSSGQRFLAEKETGMICGGRIRVRFTAIDEKTLLELENDPKIRREQEGIIWIIGAGHVGRALAKVLGILGRRYGVADDRPRVLLPEFFPDAEKIVCVDYDRLEEKIRITQKDMAVVTTYGHKGDLTVLSKVLAADPLYVGCIGSHKKAQAVKEALEKQGFSGEQTAKIHSPIGLEIGAQTPGEIAVSIAAQLIEKGADMKKKSPGEA